MSINIHHPYKPPRPEGDYYSEPFSDPPGSMLLYHSHYKLRHELWQCWEEWGEPKPVECIVYAGKEPYTEGEKAK